MLRTHDNWERLVAATLKRQEIWELCHAPSISVSSRSSDFSSFSLDSSSRFHQNPAISNDFELESVVNNVESMRSESIFVNGKPLDSRELIILQNCRNPPKKLKPGSYWYDRSSGFWGKQGHKPSQIISANLDVGDWLQTKASQGDTFVYLNGREITKPELRMLKLAGVRCYPDTHFWINEYGSYQEEGDYVVKGSLWDKVGMKLICSLLSLPFPPKTSYSYGGLSAQGHINDGQINKFLLIGCSGSGTSTIFAQAVDVFQPNCEPSRMDIYAGGFRSSVLYMDFSFPRPHYDDIYSEDEDEQDVLQRYRLIRSPPRSLEESNELLETREVVQVVIFTLSLSNYDQLVVDANGEWVNKMILDMQYFASVVTRPIYDQTCFLLLLTKYDLFEEKIEQSPLSQCNWFHDFRPVLNRNGDSISGNLGQIGFSYISVKFKKLYASLTGRKLYVKVANGLDGYSIDAALRYAKEILKWEEEKNDYFYGGYSSFEESSYSEESD